MELISSSEDQLRQENAELRGLVERYHHHLKVGRLLQDAPLAEIGAWIVNGEILQREAEEIVPKLK